MSQQSSVSDALFLLENCDDFQQHSLKLVQDARRYVAILSTDLDAPIYDREEFISGLSQLVRHSRFAQVHILVKNTKPLIERGHKLARLAQRLSSKILLRKLTLEPENSDMGFMLRDSDGLLYKNDDQVYRGFANYAAAAEVKRLRETFDYLWQYAEPEPDLQLLHI
jgi:hypothetical protein